MPSCVTVRNPRSEPTTASRPTGRTVLKGSGGAREGRTSGSSWSGFLSTKVRFSRPLLHEGLHAIVKHVLGDAYLLSSYHAHFAQRGGTTNYHTDQFWMPPPTSEQRQTLVRPGSVLPLIRDEADDSQIRSASGRFVRSRHTSATWPRRLKELWSTGAVWSGNTDRGEGERSGVRRIACTRTRQGEAQVCRRCDHGHSAVPVAQPQMHGEGVE